MTYIDKAFYELTSHLLSLSKNEIFNNIKNNYLKVPDNIKNGIEDFFKKFNYWGKLDYKNNEFEELKNRTNSIYNNLDKFIWLYEKLGDYRSKKILYAILNNWYNYDFITLRNCFENNYPYYFDLDLVKCSNDEVFVDLGAYTGDTISDYLRMYNKRYQKIYAYEITDSSFKILENKFSKNDDIILRKKAVSDKSGTMYLRENSYGNEDANGISNEGSKKIDVVSIDEDIKDDISLIKMDIEGYEYKAMLGCSNHIINNKPKLLISVYHNHQDIYRIPLLIETLKPGYKFYLRYHGNNIFPTEVTLIAIYEDKNN